MLDGVDLWRNCAMINCLILNHIIGFKYIARWFRKMNVNLKTWSVCIDVIRNAMFPSLVQVKYTIVFH